MPALNRYLILNSDGMGRAVKRLRGVLKADECVFPLTVNVPVKGFGPRLSVDMPLRAPEEAHAES